MASAKPIRSVIDEVVTRAIQDVVGSPASAAVRSSNVADLQADGVLALARQLGQNPRELAEAVVARINEIAPGLGAFSVSGPGFINITISDTVIADSVRSGGRDGARPERSGPRPRVVIDYSQPNVAKTMHVGHLRGTLIGDALARIEEFAGAEVIRQNHIGDWGTQFGMLIQKYAESAPGDGSLLIRNDGAARTPSDLNEDYRAARERFERDEAFAERARLRVVALQSGDPETVAAWKAIVAESQRYFDALYAQLGVLLEPQDVVGESAYNSMLPSIVEELLDAGVAVESDGAICVFSDLARNKDGAPTPLIVRKRDGGYGYATTDLAALKYRIEVLKADRILYVVDGRQSLHFKQVFDAARRAGWVPDHVELRHVDFGTVLRPDGKPYKTREGTTESLSDLIEQSIAHAGAALEARSPEMSAELRNELSRQLGVGAVKFADLQVSRTKDYTFDLARMHALNGNTALYLQYAAVRARSILRKVEPVEFREDMVDGLILEPAERSLALMLDNFTGVIEAGARECSPHLVANYLSQTAEAFTQFYEHCSVGGASTMESRAFRLELCRSTARTLETGLLLLGIDTPQAIGIAHQPAVVPPNRSLEAMMSEAAAAGRRSLEQGWGLSR